MPLRLSAVGAIAFLLAALPACGKKPNATQPDAPPDATQPNAKQTDPAGAKKTDPVGNDPNPKSKADPAAKPFDTHGLLTVVIGLMTTQDEMGVMPPTGTLYPPGTLKAKEPWDRGCGLSWRVLILPHAGEGALYKEFKLDEPWDSLHNKKLIEKMPKLYESANATAPPGHTYFKGNGWVFKYPSKNPSSFPDGPKNTILVFEAGEPVIWTKPEDVWFDVDKPLPELKLKGRSDFGVVMAEGTRHVIDLTKVSEKTLRAAYTPASKDTLGPDWPAPIK